VNSFLATDDKRGKDSHIIIKKMKKINKRCEDCKFKKRHVLFDLCIKLNIIVNPNNQFNTDNCKNYVKEKIITI